MGIGGGLVISRWSWDLGRSAARQLLAAVRVGGVTEAARETPQKDRDTVVSDLHVWEVGPGARVCIVSLVGVGAYCVESYRETILGVAALSHLTIDVNPASPR